MIWELQRYDWSSLRAAGDAEIIPSAVILLQKATTIEEADKAYWRIDNTVIVQGTLFEAAVPIIPCLLSALLRCTDVARPRILELLEQVGGGIPSSSEIQAGNTRLKENSLRELCNGLAIYFDLLENGTEEEQSRCIDLVGLCTTYDATIEHRVRWWFEKLLSRDLQPGYKKLIKNWLEDLK